MAISASVGRQIENEKAFNILKTLYGDSSDARDTRNDEVHDTDKSRYDTRIICIKCECSDKNCELRIPLTIGEYQKIHDDKSTFIVSPGHRVDMNEVISIQKLKYSTVKKNILSTESSTD